MKKEEAWKIVGGLSEPSKMPCYGYSLPANECKMGALMRKNPDTICAKCYAHKGRYVFTYVKAALYNRLRSLTDSRWVDAMVTLISNKKYFRWHDSGDIQNLDHFKKILEVVKLTPNTLHWLPTREFTIVSNYFNDGGICPENIAIRLSSMKVDGPAPVAMARKYNLLTCTVGSTSHTCPASLQGNKCNDCRTCWDKSVFNIEYKKH